MAMRIRRIILQTTLLVIALVVAFVGGFSYQDLSFGGKQPCVFPRQIPRLDVGVSARIEAALLPKSVEEGPRKVRGGQYNHPY
jgi:hypothetical protein